ncbi:hypothetical protein [Chromobacterium violaceum]|uniref:hypothetical protein n=1 Tax=Chromobacterium violaceum TaxID=536 RepID=UPI0009DA5CEF|nr:hypothetical protein [Chromobacterium violaceum]OQS47491.1 hypothetical protein B0T48_12475 [Chromobacterium violaceum]
MDFDFWSSAANKLVIPIIGMIMVPWLNSRYKSSNITFRKDKRIIRLDFINSYLAFDIEKRHPISTELAFEFFFGRPIPFEEIEHILKLKNPTVFAKLLKDTSDFVKFDSNIGQYVFKKGYETSRKRKLARFYRFIGYAFFAFLAFFLVENSSALLKGAPLSLIVMFTFIVFIFFFSAFTIIKDAPKVIRAEKTIEESMKFKK